MTCPCRRDPPLERTARQVCEAAGQDPDEFIHVPPHPRWWAVSLCAGHHREQHSMNERSWWASKGLDGTAVAQAQFAEFQGSDQ